MKSVQLTAREVRMDLAIRSLAALALAAVLFALFPSQDEAQALLGAGTIEEVRAIFRLEESQESFHTLRAFFVVDCLFLLGIGFIIRSTLLSRDYVVCRWRRLYPQAPGLEPWISRGLWASTVFMLADISENLTGLGILAKVFSDDTGPLPLAPILRLAFALKWLGFAAAIYCCGRAWHSKRWLPWIFYASAVFALIGVYWPFAQNASFALAAAAFAWQAFYWGAPRFVFRLVYFLRVPFIGILLSALLAPLALAPLRHFLGSSLYFDANRAGSAGLAFYSYIAFILALSLSSQAAIVLERGAERFEMPSLGFQSWPWLRAWFQYAAMAAAAIPALSAVAISFPLGSQRFYWGLLMVLAGWFAATLTAVTADFLRAWLFTRGVDQPYVILPRRFAPAYKAFLSSWVVQSPPRPLSYVGGLLQSFMGLFRRILGEGYFDQQKRLYPDHAFALLFFGLTTAVFLFLIWLGVYIAKAPVPTLTSITFLMLFLCLGFAALSFHLDRYRIPLLFGVLGLRVFFGLLAADTDHRFTIEADAAASYKTPAEILAAHPKPILIAASGGGIQASAWLTRLVQGLVIEPDYGFRNRVALMSTVSGGSVGAFYLGNYWNDYISLASEQSRQSSLGAVSWAFAGPDLFRPFAVFLGQSKLDRGYALEATLRARSLPGTDQSNTLDHWAAKVGPDFPAFLLNATVTETGGPVAFATTQLPSKSFLEGHPNPLTDGHVVQSFASFRAEHCPAAKGNNVHIATAARLSASFPYVSPAARPDGPFDLCNYHFVDGGYYDNYGIVGLLQWLDDALENTEPAKLPKSIGIMVVRGLNLEASMPAKRWDFTDQSNAPLQTFLSMRGYAQWQGASAAIRLFLEKWCLKRPQLVINVERLEYPDLRKRVPACAEEPLTWKLTAAEQDCLDKAYNDLKSRQSWANVLRW